MKRLTGIACCVAIVCGALAGYGPGAALATGPPIGKLTHSEYAQLVAQQKALKSAVKRRSVFAAMREACRLVRGPTALASNERVDCLDSIAVVEGLVYLSLVRKACDTAANRTTTLTTTTATGTTTGTGTTPTGTGPGSTTTTTTGTTQQASLVCMNPIFQSLRGGVAVMYAKDVELRRVLLARRLPARCVDTIGPSLRVLKLETHLLAATRTLAGDTALLTKVARGQAPSSHVHMPKIIADEVAYGHASGEFLASPQPTKLSVCPHE